MIRIKPLCFSLTLLMAGSFFYSPVQAQNSDDLSRKKSKKEKKAEQNARVNEMIRKEEEGALIYSKQWMIGGKLYNDGWGAFYEHGKMKSVDVTNWWSVELGERKHPKEEKVAKSSGGGFFFGNPLIYGKQNNFYFTKVGFGQQRLLGGKGNKNGVAVSALYGGGLSLGLLKPYYLDVTDPLTGQSLTVKYTGEDTYEDTLFLDPNAIDGHAGMFKGFNEMKVTPGVFMKAGMRFDYGRYNELISAIECGINIEYYFKDMPIMALNEPKKAFINVFAALEFGRRK